MEAQTLGELVKTVPFKRPRRLSGPSSPPPLNPSARASSSPVSAARGTQTLPPRSQDVVGSGTAATDRRIVRGSTVASPMGLGRTSVGGRGGLRSIRVRRGRRHRNGCSRRVELEWGRFASGSVDRPGGRRGGLRRSPTHRSRFAFAELMAEGDVKPEESPVAPAPVSAPRPIRPVSAPQAAFERSVLRRRRALAFLVPMVAAGAAAFTGTAIALLAAQGSDEPPPASTPPVQAAPPGPVEAAPSDAPNPSAPIPRP